MVMTDGPSPHLLDAVKDRSRSIVENLKGLGEDELQQASDLPGWSRLTIACHLGP